MYLKRPDCVRLVHNVRFTDGSRVYTSWELRVVMCVIDPLNLNDTSPNYKHCPPAHTQQSQWSITQIILYTHIHTQWPLKPRAGGVMVRGRHYQNQHITWNQHFVPLQYVWMPLVVWLWYIMLISSLTSGFWIYTYWDIYVGLVWSFFST